MASEVRKEVMRGMELIGNPSSFNDAGRIAAFEINKARVTVAQFLNAHVEEIIFTSSGSEANNMAILCTASKSPKNRDRIIVSPIEHLSILEPAISLKNKKVVYLKVDKEGFVNLEDAAAKISEKTFLVSLMYANNEIGTIQPIIKLGKIIKNSKKGGRYPLFHVDACQAAGVLNMNVNSLGADLLTFNGSKINGPRGIGVLYVKKGTPLDPYIMGGGQERGLRAGTENLSGILGLAKAIELIDKKGGERLRILRDYFFSKLGKIVPEAKINGPEWKNRLPNNINISILDLDSENMLLELDKYGISAGSGSACTARSVEPSHVLKAIGVGKEYLNGALRLSLGKQTTKKQIDYVLKILPKIISNLKKRYKIV